MLAYPNINPVAFHIFSWPVYWYGMMYLVGFVGGWILLSLRLKCAPRGFTQDELSDLIFYAALGAILGGRIGYMLFYDFNTLIHDPLMLFQTWKGGMSFHGGLLGVVIALYWNATRIGKPFLALTDFIAPVVPVGLGAGRIGNFINGELWGRVSDVPWAMVFPNGGLVARHPSQLYEFALEGVVLFICLWVYSRVPRRLGAVSGWFALGYSLFRIIAECFREPDAPIGYWFGVFTQGQLLSLPLAVIGIWLILRSRTQKVLV